MIEINWKPTTRQLRFFAVATLVFFGGLAAWLAWRQSASTTVVAILAGFGGVVGVVGLIAPRAIRPVYLGVTVVTLPIGLVVSFVLLAATYFLVLTPIGLLRRAIAGDPLKRRFEPERESYWVPRRKTDDPKRAFRQY